MKSGNILNKPVLMLIIGAISISFSSVWVKLADVPPSTSAFYRVFFGSIFLFLLFLRSKEHTSLKMSHLALGCLCGLLFAFDLVCWHSSIVRIGPGLATLLGNFEVFILAGIGFFILKERYSSTLLISLPMAMFGLFLIIGYDWPTLDDRYREGLFLGLATAVFYSGYILSLRYFSAYTKSKYLPMLLLSSCCSIILAAYLYIVDVSFIIPDTKSFVSLVCLGFLSQCFGWLLIAASLPQIKASTAGLILLLQPSLSFVWDVLFFSRPTTILNWVGVFIALTSIYLGISAKQKK